MQLSRLGPLRFEKKSPPTAKPVASPSMFAPAKGVVIHGTPYQGGEQIPEEVVSKLSPGQQARLHRDPKAAEEAFRKEPALSKGEREAGQRVPRIGRRQRPDYAEPPLQRPRTTSNSTKQAETPEEGRSLLPEDLTSPDLLTDEEAKELSPLQARQFVRHFNKLPSDLEYVAAAKAGMAKRGWYNDAAKTLRSLFGPEAGRFVALLAATSPQVPVEENLQKAAEIWRFYQEWMAERAKQGKSGPPSYEEVKGEIEKWKAREGREFNPIGIHDNNIALALSADDPGHTAKVVLSGPKVDSFRRNLLGNLMAATNDVWMSYMGGFDQAEISGRSAKHPDKADVKIAKLNGAYLANTVKLRRTAQKLNTQLQPGEQPWTTAEVQETVWSFFRALAYVGGRSRTGGRTPLDPVQALNALTHETVHGNADFVTLLFKRNPDGSKNSVIRNLEAAGLGPTLVRIFRAYKAKERRQAETRPSGSVQDALSPDERRALVPVARRAGQNVKGFMGTQRYARRDHPLRFAAVEQPPAPIQQPVPAPPQAQNQAQAPVPPAPGQLPPIDEHREALLAYSPNVDDLSFEDALARSRSGNHKAFKKIVEHINEQVGLHAHLSDAIGDWSDGAENSILQRIDEPVDQKTVDYLASWYGLLANQKAMLAFTPLHGGLDSVYQIEVPQTDLGQIRKSLDKAGIPFRTLVPGKKGTKIVIYDEKRGMREQVANWASLHNADIRESIGQGRFIGGSTRTAARAKYRKIITSYEATAAKSGGQVRSYRPTVLPNHLRSGEGEETPVRKARSGEVIHFASGPLGRNRSMPQPQYVEQPPKETGFVRPPEANFEPGDVRSGLSFGLDWWSVNQLRKLYRSVRHNKGESGRLARRFIRQVWRGDVWAIEPALDAVAEAGGEATVDEMFQNGFSPDLMRSRLVEMGKGPEHRRKRWRNDNLFNEWDEQNSPLESMAEDERSAPTVPTLRDYGKKLGQGLKNIGKAALRTLVDKDSMPKGLRRDLHGSWDDYHARHGLPRDEAPEINKREAKAGEQIRPIVDVAGGRQVKLARKLRFSGIHAPAGGVVVRGLFYPGGKWIPSARLEKASYDQYQQVEKARAKKQYRREDGSISVEPALTSNGAREARHG